MNRKQLTILIGLGLVVGGLGFYLYNRDTTSWKSSGQNMGQKVLGEFPLNDVSQIVIKQAQSELNLFKKDDIWKVRERYDYPANFTEIGDFLRKVAELKAVQRVQVGPSQLARLDLVTSDKGTSSATLVEFKDQGGKTIKSLLLGKKHVKQSEGASQFGGGEWPDGRFVKVLNEQSDVAIVSDPLSNVEPKPEPWLNKDFLKVEKIKTVSVTQTNATNSWKLSRETESGEMKLADLKEGEQLDTAKISGVANVFSYPNFNDVVSPQAKPEETGMDNPIVARLETFDGFVYTIRIGKKSGEENQHLNVSVTADIPKERVPGKEEKPEDKTKLDKEFKEKSDKLTEKLSKEKPLDKWTYLVSKWTVDPLLKDRSQLLAEKKEEPKKDETKKDDKTEPPVPLLPEVK